MWSLDIFALIMGAFFLAGLAKGALGLGFVVVVLAFLATTLGLKEAIALLVIPGICTNIWQAVIGGGFVEILRRCWSLFAATIIGIWVGVQVLATGNADKLIIVLGTVLILYSTVSLRRPQLPRPGKAEIWLSPTIGLAGGVIAGLTGSYIVPGVLYLQTLGLSRDVFVQAMGMAFLLIAIVLGILLWRHEIVTAEIGMVSTIALAPSALGMFAGQKLRTRMSEGRFRQAFFAALIVVGIYMIVRALI